MPEESSKPIRPASGSLGDAAVGFVAGAVPMSVALSVPPLPSLFNEVLALICWGLFAARIGGAGPFVLFSRRAAEPLVWALGLIAAAAWLPLLRFHAPVYSALITTGLMWTCYVLFQLGAQLRDPVLTTHVLRRVFAGMLFTAAMNAVFAVIQVRFPTLADGYLIPQLHFDGRAVGTLRQPNQLAAMQVWALLGVGWLLAAGKIPAAAGWAAAVLLLVGASLSGSRTGVVNVFAISAWGAMDKTLPPSLRRLFAATLPIFLAATLLLHFLLDSTAGTEAGLAGRLSDDAGTASRWLILRDGLGLAMQYPWLGTGWGEFNLVWTLTPRSWPTIHHFSNSHNLLLELVVELGLPLGLLVIVLVALGIKRAFVAARAPERPICALSRRIALAMVVAMLVYSQFEFPLWYVYFLLPTVFFLGLASRPPAMPDAPAAGDGSLATLPRKGRQRPIVVAGLLITLGGTFVLFDAMKVVQIYMPPTIPRPASVRIAEGQRSVLFRPFADFAAATNLESPGEEVFVSAARSMLDELLLLSWAEHWHARGDDERAAFLVQRALAFKSALTEQHAARCASPRGPSLGDALCGRGQPQLGPDDFRR